MSSVIDDLSAAAHRIAGGNFAWRMPVRSKDQLGDLSCNFNEVAIAQDRPQEEAAAEESSMSIFAQESECRG